MQFIDLKAQYQVIQKDLKQRLDQVFEHGHYVNGPEIIELEQKLADFVGVKHCLTCGNGTDALLLALLALDIKPGDEVITTAFTFIAPASMAAFLGAKPVFVDIDPNTFNINPDLIEAAINEKTKAIIAVDLYGQCADFAAINKIANKYGLKVIEDAAQSMGASQNNKMAGSLADIACTSFFPAKPLGGYGEGGACFTNDDRLINQLKLWRSHGENGRYNHVQIGLNSRFDTIQAAVMLAKFNVFKAEIKQRQAIAKKYDQLLRNIVKTPYIAPNNQSVYAQYTICTDQREHLIEALQKNAIPTAIHYPKALHEQPVFANPQANFPVAERLTKEVLSLPFHPYLTQAELEKVTSCIQEALNVAIKS